jgi:segregation and condensation protein B
MAEDLPPSAADAERRRAVEAILMVADEPVPPGLLAQLLEVKPAHIEALCAQMAAIYEAEDRGFVLTRVAGGYRFQSHPDMAPYVERFILEGQSAKLSAAALETLAIVAYKQPVSRAQVGAIRGVNVDAVMRTLQQRGYIAEVGKDPGPGQAVLYGTTRLFLEKLGLDSLADLPSLGEFVPSGEVVEALERGLTPEE